jgi:hypothetical protein
VPGYSSFFDQGAEVAGTLIGLLFVAISLSPHDRQAVPFRVHTAAAFTALIDALVVSLTALLPGDSVGTSALAASIAGLSTTVGLTVVSIQRWPGRRLLRDLAAIPFLAAAYLIQLLDSTRLLTTAAKPDALRTQAALVIFFLLVAITSAWQLIGAHGGMLLSVIAETASRHRADGASDPQPSGPPRRTEVTGLPRPPASRSLSRTDRGACRRSSSSPPCRSPAPTAGPRPSPRLAFLGPLARSGFRR